MSISDFRNRQQKQTDLAIISADSIHRDPIQTHYIEILTHSIEIAFKHRELTNAERLCDLIESKSMSKLV